MHTWGIQASRYKWRVNIKEIFTLPNPTNHRCFRTCYTNDAWQSCTSNFHSQYLSHHRQTEHVTPIQSKLRNMIGQDSTTHDWVKQQLPSMKRAFTQRQLVIWRHLETFHITDYMCYPCARITD